MQKENKLTVGQWCDYWFTANRRKWNGNTEGGYRNLIYSHILPGIGSVALSDLPLRYNYDKPEKPRISRVFGYLARFFILFQTEKSSREVVIS